MEKAPTKRLLGNWALSQVAQTLILYASKYYRGLLEFVAPRPFSADIHVSTKCNSRCISCNYWRPEARNTSAPNDLTPRQVENIFVQLHEIGIRVVGLGGAEPLIRKDIGELIKKAKDIVGGKVYLTTNGLLLEHKAETVLENGVDHVSVSIDGIGATNDKIRGIPGSYERAIRGIERLMALIDSNGEYTCVCNIGTTIMKMNIDEIPDLIELARRLGTHWNFNLLDNNISFAKSLDLSELFAIDSDSIDRNFTFLRGITRSAAEVFTLDPASLKYAKAYLKDKTPYQHCFQGYFRLYIDSFMNVYPGCFLLPPVGNLQCERLKDILEKDIYVKRVEQMYRMECPGCTCGYLYNCMIEELPSSISYFLSKSPTYRKYL